MPAAKNPVERGLEQLRELWLQATEAPERRLLVWRTPGNAERMIDAFFEIQKHPGPWAVPDMFLALDAEFETGYGYSRTLKEALVASYSASRDGFIEEGAADWGAVAQTYADSPEGVVGLLDAFARHHRDYLRNVVLVVRPKGLTSGEALERWVQRALATPATPMVKFCMADDRERSQWQALVGRMGAAAHVIDAELDMFDIASQTAAQAGGGGATAAYRPMLVDVMTTLEKSGPAEVSTRAARALRIAEREQWHDQQVVLHMAVAGAHMKQQQFGEAIIAYRKARDCAQLAPPAVGPNLAMQSWFGEAGAWLAAQQWEKAANGYQLAAQQAKAVPNLMFVVEGLRMSSFCLLRAGQHNRARDMLLDAVGEAKAITPAERPMTTFPFVLHDLLKLQDAARTGKLEALAERYKRQIEDARLGAEVASARLGAQPSTLQLDAIDRQMLEDCERAFAKLCSQREALIAGGDVFFRKVVAVARDMLHPQWNGLPEVKHPLDKSVPEWDAPPQFAVAPDGAALEDEPRLSPVPVTQPVLEASGT